MKNPKIKNHYKNTNLIYLHADLSHQYRNKFELFKYRDLNDLHHAHDAYLAIVLGLYKNKYFNKKVPEVINPLDNVVCIYCKEPMHRIKDNAVMIATGKYAHPKCVEIESKRELTDKEKLERYIMKLFKVDFVPPRMQQQINKYA